MRNLKKILALVLALIMSLSLMATAGAADFTDAADITDTFEESVDVLDGLKVFQGYPGGDFQPQGEIKRSEVAVIIYRIATGDIEGTQVGIYKDHNKFSDVTSSHWAAGYINYCANAEYIKGRSAKIFDPEGRVTGYEALAMILRAIGYDKNNEFTGSSWKIQTAATAKQRGIIENINEGLLGQAATREMVAEILCQTILVNQVNYTPAFGYQEGNTSLGYDTFKLEKLTGVVTGNEYADLESTSAMGNDITRLVVGERKLNLQVESYFDDIGETRYTYVRPTDKSEFTLVTSKLYEEEGANDVKESGDATSVSSLAGSLRTDGDTQYFVNYDEGREWKCDIRIAYYIDKEDADIMGWDDFLEDVVGRTRFLRRDAAGNDIPWDDTTSQHPGADTFAGYYRWIQPGEEILPTDRTILKAIFDDADLQGMIPSGTTTPTIPTTNIVIGEVYVGTQSKTDISDSISWNQFVSTYVGDEMEKVSGTTNGNYLKVIDNDNDGNVEYVLRTDFVLDEVAAMNGDKVFYRNTNGTGIANGSTVRYQSGEYKYDGTYKYNDTPELSTGTVVVAAQIEGTWYAQICAPVTATIKTINFTVPSATTTEDAEYKQSAILNNTTMPELLVEMSELTEYGVYLDLFGHLRAYDAPVSGRYALLTEMYPKGDYNVNYVRNIPWVAEMMTPGTTYPVENNVLNAYPNTRENAFIDNQRVWNYGVLTGRNDYLQSVVDHLDLNSLTEQGKNGGLGNADNDQAYPIANQGNEFGWAAAVSESRPNGESYTNVAKYTKSGDGAYLYSASEYATDNSGNQLYYGWYDTNTNDVVDAGDVIYRANGTVTVLTAATIDANGMYKGAKFTAASWAAYVNRYGTNLNVAGAPAVDTNVQNFLQPVYAEDYIQMKVEDILAGDRQFTMSKYDNNGVTGKYTGYVEATNQTEFYVVGPNPVANYNTDNRSIKHFTGYTGLTAYDGTYAHRASDIAAIYAVAKNTTANNDQADYWVADVIVIELATDRGMTYNSVSLTYSIPSMTTANIRQANALNNETVGVKQTLYPNNVDWGNNLNGNWFYGLTDTQTFEDGVKANLHRITQGRYNANGIYAGTVVSVNGNYGGGAYLAMDTNNDGINTTTRTINTSEGGNPVPIYAVALGSATELQIVDTSRNSQISAGDRLIWVYNSDRQIDFIINASYYANHSTTTNADLFKSGAGTMYKEIIDEQSVQPEAPGALNVLFYDVDDATYAGATPTGESDLNGTANQITISCADAVKGDGKGLVVTGGTVISTTAGGTTVTGNTVPASPNRKGATYQVVIRPADGSADVVYTLVVNPGASDTALYYNGAVATMTSGRYIYPAGSATMGDIMRYYRGAAGTNAKYVFKNGNGDVVPNADNTVCTNPNWTVEITIEAEDGTEATYRVFLDGTAQLTADLLGAYLTKNENNQVVYDIYWNPVNKNFYLATDTNGEGTGTAYNNINLALAACLNKTFEEIGATMNADGGGTVVGDNLTNLGYVKDGTYGVMQYPNVVMVNDEDAGNLVTLKETIFVKVNCADPKSVAAAQSFTNEVEYTIYAVKRANGAFGGFATVNRAVTSADDHVTYWQSDNAAYALEGLVNKTIHDAGIADRYVRVSSFEYGIPGVATADWKGDQARHVPASLENPVKTWPAIGPAPGMTAEGSVGKWQMQVEILSANSDSAHTYTVGSVTFNVAGVVTTDVP